MSRSRMVNVDDDYASQVGMTTTFGLVLRGPYEKAVKITKAYSSCHPVFDLLVDGKIYKAVPCDFCTKVKN